MPNTEGAVKALRASKRKAVFNLRRKVAMKKAVKRFRELVKDDKFKEAEAEMPLVYKAIDKAEKRGIIKKNTASRKKSRLSVLLNKEKAK